MKLSNFALLSSVASTSLAVIFSAPVRAASFNYNDLQLIQARPLTFTDSLNFFGGTSSDNQGYVAFFNVVDPNVLDAGHLEVSLNDPALSIAPYYASGRNASPLVGNTATRAATLNGINGFSNFSNYVTTNSISISDLGYGFGAKSNQDFRQTWNLGADLFGQNWLGSPTSTVEERIYAANPNAVERFMNFGTTKILQFGYSDEHVAFDYGATSGTDDDLEVLFSNPVTVSKELGLSPLLDGLADAFLADVNQSSGGRIQFVSEDEGAPFLAGDFQDPYFIANVRLPLSVRIVSESAATAVPEPSGIGGLLLLGTFGLLNKLKKAFSADR
ncbi:PEP-CTERM sorting domain-containing protein [Chamaesiphon sp. OTE_75_metabat_556]|uniref:PEP-CTERM sorting domain-containing protein n=1 Tax=Chamaesiphon sp. OTE_75_metabat_556 TaxID=2964692 RepID=UPI00286D6992|nr:PEP-CTERM sorting domain-containing protein [Chamaesiphon sp. OTE_75_metabat_556]